MAHYRNSAIKSVHFSSEPPVVSYIPGEMGTWENSREPAYNATAAEVQSARKLTNATFAEIEALELASLRKPLQHRPLEQLDESSTACKASNVLRESTKDVESAYWDKKMCSEFGLIPKQTSSNTNNTENVPTGKHLGVGRASHGIPPNDHRHGYAPGLPKRKPLAGGFAAVQGATRPSSTRAASDFTKFLAPRHLGTWDQIDKEHAERQSISSERLRKKVLSSAIDFGKAAKEKFVQTRDEQGWKTGMSKLMKKR